ncbi:hypothetical protein DRJ17_04160 [Candidatus Woesearchaeota archaeon]|nr:MAG: hypothetical protein DRJ17_04160 [Candidatus Woesearchaeota archaeon]
MLIENIVKKLVESVRGRIALDEVIRTERSSLDLDFILALYEKTRDVLDWEYDINTGKFYVKPKKRVEAAIEAHKHVSKSLANFKEVYEEVKKRLYEKFGDDIIPKTMIIDFLKDVVGENYEIYYRKLIDDGVVEEELFRGMFFVKIRRR